ncbi:unnamed protein product, partial [Coregonus sp. 'balchen']
MEDRVEVFLRDTAQITCMFTVSDNPDDVIIQWYMITKTNVRLRIYYGDSTIQVVDRGGQFTDKISVIGNGKSSEVVLTIRDVALEDELEFICQVNGLSAESPDRPIIEGVHSGISVSNKNPSKIGSCEAKNGYPRPNITWYRDQISLQNTPGVVSVVTLVTKESSGLYTVQSDLHLNVVKEDKDSFFYCEVSYLVPGGTKMTETNKINITVHYLDLAILIPKDTHVMAQGEELMATCNALSSLPTHTEWFKKGEKVAEGHTLTLKDAVFDMAGTYVCVVKVPSLKGLETSGSLHVLVQGPPEIKESADTVLEESTEKSLKLSCHVRGYPTPVITWSSSDQSQVDRQTEDEVLSVVSVKVTSDITAYCNASNNHGTDSISFSIKASKFCLNTCANRRVSLSLCLFSMVQTTSSAPSTTGNDPWFRLFFFVPPEGSGVIIAVIIICILLLAILGSVLYFLHMKGKIPCVNGDKKPPSD